jgi:hypothetical protein
MSVADTDVEIHCNDPFNGCCLGEFMPGQTEIFCHCKCVRCKNKNFNMTWEPGNKLPDDRPQKINTHDEHRNIK